MVMVTMCGSSLLGRIREASDTRRVCPPERAICMYTWTGNTQSGQYRWTDYFKRVFLLHQPKRENYRETDEDLDSTISRGGKIRCEQQLYLCTYIAH